MSTQVTITTTGGVFTNGARIVADAADDFERTLGFHTEDLIRRHLQAAFRHPTGTYLRHLHTTVRSRHVEVNDGGIVYGPWLEGLSSRNQSSRFKGYSAFRRAAQITNRDAARILEPDLARLARRLQ